MLLSESETIIDALAQLVLKSTVSADDRRAVANKFFIDHSGEPEEVNTIKNFSILNEDFQIPVRLYRINNSKKICLFIHGGGWIQGNLDTHDYLCRKIAKICEVNVLAVDYRLAPEHEFPIPLNDVNCVYNWCCERYDEILLSGDSAGGHLCAAVCIQAAKTRKPDAMILFYPALGSDFNSESYKKYADIPTLSKPSVKYFLSKYIGNQSADNRLISPILENDMNVFPKTFIVSAGCDVLLSEQSAFFEKMLYSNNACRQLVLDGAIHGFMTYGREFDKYNTEILKQVSGWLRTVFKQV